MAGLTIGLLVNNIKHIALSGLGGCVFAMSFLIVMGMEGIFCALMAAPLAMAAMIVAGLLVHVARLFSKRTSSTPANTCRHSCFSRTARRCG